MAKYERDGELYNVIKVKELILGAQEDLHNLPLWIRKSFAEMDIIILPSYVILNVMARPVEVYKNDYVIQPPSGLLEKCDSVALETQYRYVEP